MTRQKYQRRQLCSSLRSVCCDTAGWAPEPAAARSRRSEPAADPPPSGRSASASPLTAWLPRCSYVACPSRRHPSGRVGSSPSCGAQRGRGCCRLENAGDVEPAGRTVIPGRGGQDQTLCRYRCPLRRKTRMEKDGRGSWRWTWLKTGGRQ